MRGLLKYLAPAAVSAAALQQLDPIATYLHNPVEPCALAGSHFSKDGFAPADVVLRCLRSVPLDAAANRLQLRGVKEFTSFQTTLAYLKDPPPGYLLPAVDVLESLSDLESDLINRKFTNEYDFQLALLRIIASTYDGHFQYWPDITQVVNFERGVSLVSISSDGYDLPKVFDTRDLQVLAETDGPCSKVSPIVKIDGHDVEAVLNEMAVARGSGQDPDSNYNAVFPIIPLVSQAIASNSTPYFGDFSKGSFYIGNQTTLLYENGTLQVHINHATSDKDWSGVIDGKTFFDKFCSGGSLSVPASPSPSPSTTEVPYMAVPTETTLPAAPYYPHPLIVASDYSIVGYLPDEVIGLAVLSIPTFVTNDPIDFQDTVRSFLATAYSKNATRLLIDLRGNGGGNEFLGYDLFTQLFPGSQPYGLTNLRATPLFNDMGKIVSDFYSNVTAANATLASPGIDYPEPFNFHEELDLNLNKFDSWTQFFGPHLIHGDNFTSTMRYNLSDPLQTGGVDPSGFQNLTGIDPVQPFAAENIVLIQDGTCASTCAEFTEAMKTKAHVKQVVFGGRKQHGPMQGVGGVKGAELWPYDLITAEIDELYTDGTPEQIAHFNHTYPILQSSMSQAIKRAAIGEDGTGIEAGVNARNQIRHGDATMTPLQFVYEAADCRLFYTARQILQQKEVWLAAHDAMWGTRRCVNGSTGQPSSLPGTSYILSPAPKVSRN